MDWYAHSIEQENETETHVEKNKVKGVIEEITSSIGSILEENFSGIIRDVEEINRLFRRSTLFKSMSRENDQLKNLVETLKKDNDRLKRKAQELQLGMTNVIGAPKQGVSLNILEINKGGEEEAKTEVIKELENMKNQRENTIMSTSPTPYENYETSSEEDEAVDADNLKKITVADYWKKTQETNHNPSVINNLKYKYKVELDLKQLDHLEEEKNYGPHNGSGIQWVTFELMLKEAMKNFLQYSPQHSGLEEELIIKDIIISSAGIKGWGEANLSSSDDEDAEELNNINTHCMNLIINEGKDQSVVVFKDEEEEEDEGEEDEGEEEEEEEDEEEDDEEEEELELNEEDIEMELGFITKNNLEISQTKNKKFYVTCYTDEEGNVYKIEEDEEVGDILGEIKNGIFFVV